MGAWMLPAIILIPLLSAAVVGYFRNTWSKTTISWVACSSVFASFALVLVLLYQFLFVLHHEPIHAPLTSWGEFLDLGLVADSLSLWWMVVVAGCGFLIHLYSTGYMHDDPSFGRFMAKLNYFIFAMSLLVLADNFAGLLMGWANVGLASYMLIGFYIQKPAASAAAMKAFVMNMIGEAGMIAGIAFIYLTFGSMKFETVFEKAAQAPFMVNTICILLLVGAVAKSAQFPLHTWLPYAMEGPTPVSALIHAATMVTAGVYLVSRAWPLYTVAAGNAMMLVAWVGAIGALMGAVIAAGQNDIKRVLAFSTMSQIGYMFMGNGLGAFVAADFHFFTHAFFKAALFLCAGIVVHHYAGDQNIRKMGGLWAKDKFAGYVFAVGTLALVGIFPFAGFFSKDEILAAAFHGGQWGLFAVGVIAAMMTAFYNVRLFSLVFLGKPYEAEAKVAPKRNASASKAHGHGHDDHGHGHEHHHETPWQMKWAVGILAVLSVVSGLIVFAGQPLHFLETTFEGLEMHHGGPIDYTVAAIATTVALIGGLVSWLLYGPKGALRVSERDLNKVPGPLVRMLYFDDLYEYLVIIPVKAISDFAANIGDNLVIDGFVNGLGKVAAGIGSGLRGLQDGYIRRYALTVFTGVTLMLLYFIFYV
ncbi:MAG TPA: NADH-quinone oxidoreductase subunit L [Symbiobacteriaceae bacterium]|nr:NADH-quinone oxidoreductase subunit L [Symbiobacteriaceae bacterium]